MLRDKVCLGQELHRIFLATGRVVLCIFMCGFIACSSSKSPTAEDAPQMPQFFVRRTAPAAFSAGWEKLANGVRGVVPVDIPRIVSIIRKEEEKEQILFPRIPPFEHPEVDYHVHFFTDVDRSFIGEALSRRAALLPQMSDIFAKYGLPDDLLNLAFIESRFKPWARSPRGGTLGLWQFAKETGKEYGLNAAKNGKDERHDIELSTDAAARHLIDLFDIFGDWYLVAAAYNCGKNRVKKAIELAGTDDIYVLASRGLISGITRAYVGRFAAVTQIMMSPESYGFPNVAPDPKLFRWILDAPEKDEQDTAEHDDLDGGTLAKKNEDAKIECEVFKKRGGKSHKRCIRKAH